MQLLKPACLESVLSNKRSPHSERPVHLNEEQPQLASAGESLRSAGTREGPFYPEINTLSLAEVDSGVEASRVRGERERENRLCFSCEIITVRK